MGQLRWIKFSGNNGENLALDGAALAESTAALHANQIPTYIEYQHENIVVGHNYELYGVSALHAVLCAHSLSLH